MVSNFYGSTQSRLKTYTSDRRVEEHNGDIQQAKVYQTLAEERGDIETADRLSKLATLVVNRFGQQVVQPAGTLAAQPFDIRSVLSHAIQNGTLSQLWDRIKKVPKKELSKTAQIIQHDLKHNKILKEVINEKLHLIMEKRLDKEAHKEKFASVLEEIIQDITGGKENESALTELLSYGIGIKRKRAADTASQAPTEQSSTAGFNFGRNLTQTRLPFTPANTIRQVRDTSYSDWNRPLNQ
jgi:hypothetical protein